MEIRCMGCMDTFSDEYEVCPHCGYIVGTEAEQAIHMEPKTILHDRYIVGKVLGFGGFGVTYIGWDGKLEQKVAIKEYLPSEFSTRMPGQSCVTIFNGDKSEQFRDGLEKFVEEAKRLAKFQNEPGIVRVFDSFTENDTAYIIMEYLDGETLTERLKRDKTIPEDEAVEMIMPVMQSLSVVHQEGILHRDIAPDNIFLNKDGTVKLIDFGASRYATTSHSRSLTVIIKPGYSPEEQYRSRGDQGDYTDVYALGATLYKMITGKTPPDAMERRAKFENQNKDILEQPHKLNKNISKIRETAILNAMNIRIEDRTPTVAAFMDELNSDVLVKRVNGRIKKIDIFGWPLWLKIVVPTVLVALITLGILLATNVIKFPSLFSDKIVIPEGTVVVPEVEGMDKDEALALIEKNDLLPVPSGNVESEYIEAGKIVLQSPTAGSYLPINGDVILTVSSGAGVVEVVDGVATVPYVIWDKKEDAIDKLLQAGLAEPIVTTKSDDNVASGMVISQSIDAGTEVKEGTQITITVSTGPAAFDMPNVVGKEMSAAKSTLEDKGLVVTVSYAKSETVKENNVISQSVTVGRKVKKGDSVTITVSSGEKLISVPYVVGKTETEAKEIIKDNGLTAAVAYMPDNAVKAGTVISQSHTNGALVKKGDSIIIYVSSGNAYIEVANVVGESESNASNILSEQGFKVITQSVYDNNVSKGQVISQNPVSGSKQPSGTEVKIIVSLGKKPIVVTFNTMGGTRTTGSDNKTVYVNNTYGTLPNVKREGYWFMGWCPTETGSEYIYSGTVVENNENHTLYARWGANEYQVTFDPVGGKCVVGSMTIPFGERYDYRNGSLPTPKLEGYTFVGWFTEKDGGTQITDSTSVSIADNHTLYARWEANTYTVTLDAKGGKVTPTTINVTYGEKYPTLPTPTLEGYWSVWSLIDPDTNAIINFGTDTIHMDKVVTTASNHTLYALWM